jgi:hypothetical protein
MKPLIPILLFLFTYPLANAQEKWFDPEIHPVAVQKDSSLHLLVSEYVLAKSLETRMEKTVRVEAVFRSEEPNGLPSLVFTGIFTNLYRQPFTLSLRLRPEPTSRFYHADTLAIICSAPGCNNCRVVNQRCEGCCDLSSGQSLSLIRPLVRVGIAVED